MNASSMVIWVLVNLTTGHTFDHYRFPTQADCLRAGNKLLNLPGKPVQKFKCESITVANGEYSSSPSPQEPVDAAAVVRAERNNDAANRQMQDLIDHPPIIRR